MFYITPHGFKITKEQLPTLRYVSSTDVSPVMSDYVGFTTLIAAQEMFYPDLIIGWRYRQATHYFNWRDNMWKFVQCKLSKDHKVPLEKFTREYKGGVSDVLQEICSMGYKVSVSWVDDKNSWVTTITGKKGAKINENVSLPSWSDDWAEALFMGAFKCIVLADRGDWSTLEQLDDNWG